MKKIYLILSVVFLAFFICQVSAVQSSFSNTTTTIKPKLVVQLGHLFVENLALSPNKKLVLSAGNDNVLKLWDVKTGREIRTFDKAHSDTIRSIAFSPDGQRALSSSDDRTVKLWNIATGHEIRTLKEQFDWLNWLKSKLKFGLQTRVSSQKWYDDVISVAFSPDGRLALSGNRDSTIKLWNLETGHEIRTFKGHSNAVTTTIFSPDARTILSGSDDSTLKLWDVTTGLELNTFKGHSDGIVGVKFSHNGLALSASLDNTVKLWDLNTGNEIRTIISLEHNYRDYDGVLKIRDVVFSSSGDRALLLIDYSPSFSDEFDKNSLVAATFWMQVELWDLKKGLKVFTLDRFPAYPGNSQPITAIALSSAGKMAITNVNEVIKIWNLESERKISKENFPKYYFFQNKGTVWDIIPDQEFGRYLYTAIPYRYGFFSYSISPENHILLSNGNTLKLWNMEEHKLITFQYSKSDDGIITAVSFSPDGKIALSGSKEGIVKLWEVSSGHEICASTLSNHPNDDGPVDVQKIAFSPDGSKVGLGVCNNSEMCTDSALAILWDVVTCSDIHTFVDNMASDISSLMIEFSPNSHYILVGQNDDAKIQLWDIAKKQEISNIYTQECRDGNAPTVGFSSGSNIVYRDCDNEMTKLWNVITGQQIISKHKIHFQKYFNNSDVEINNVYPTKNISISGLGEEATLLGWKKANSVFQVKNIQTGEELAQLIFFTEDKWAIVTPDGRYDTNSPGDLPGISWVMPDDPLTPLPVEIFMKEYFEPRLLPRLLKGESLPPIKPVGELNRVQPKIEIIQITPNRDEQTLVSVTIEVAGNQKDFQRNGKTITQTTGVHDLRLFRDGQLVAYAPKTSGKIKLNQKTNQAILTFDNIRLPRKPNLKQVEFSAYAFNDDGVKSATAHKTYVLPQNLKPVKGKIYLITIGVNAYENPAWDLNFAANDARTIQSILSQKIAQSQSNNYTDIIPITLISDYQYQQGQRVLTINQASKPIIQALFNKLAGQFVDPTLLAGIPNADKLQTAQPEDMLLLSFSSHGYADNKGNFYLFPYDIGTNTNKEITEALLSHTISSEELSLWLRDVDAGDMVMIIDACHSAASVEGEGFKPGPMGSRGLGQLAYDKGMRILTASQADDIALEHDDLEHGFLTYSLIQDGIQAGKADWKPKDLQIMLGEWLQYGEKRVPELYASVRNGLMKTYNRGKVIRIKEKEQSTSSRLRQQPSLFDFTKRKEDIVVARTRQ